MRYESTTATVYSHTHQHRSTTITSHMPTSCMIR